MNDLFLSFLSNLDKCYYRVKYLNGYGTCHYGFYNHIKAAQILIKDGNCVLTIQKITPTRDAPYNKLKCSIVDGELVVTCDNWSSDNVMYQVEASLRMAKQESANHEKS